MSCNRPRSDAHVDVGRTARRCLRARGRPHGGRSDVAGWTSGPPVPVSASPAAVRRALKTDAPVSVQENLARAHRDRRSDRGFRAVQAERHGPQHGRTILISGSTPLSRTRSRPTRAAAIKRPGIAQKSPEVDGPNGKKELRFEGQIATVPLNTFATEVHTLHDHRPGRRRRPGPMSTKLFTDERLTAVPRQWRSLSVRRS